MTTPFGKQCREKYFSHIPEDIIPVNHGAYGNPPDKVLEAYSQAMYAEAAFPDKYIHVDHPKNYEEALKLVASVINADWHNLVLVNSTTAAINCILRSQTIIKRGVTLAITSHCFSSNLNTIKYLGDVHDVGVVVIDISPTMTESEIVGAFALAFATNTDIEFVHFELIPLVPAFKLPYKEVLAVCRQYGVKTIVDGAHALGQIKIDFSDEELKPDFWFSNLHKWLYVPKGSCVIHVDPKFHADLVPWPIQGPYDASAGELTLLNKFVYLSLKHYPSIAVIPTAIAERKKMGGELAINSYCSSLAEKVGKTLSESWGGLRVFHSPELALVNVQLPIYPEKIKDHQYFNEWMIHKLCDKGTCAPIFKIDKKWFVRLSCQVYNEVEDYVKAGKILIDTIKEWNEEQKDK